MALDQHRTSKRETLEIYTDGSSRGNPGPAAYAFLFVHNGTVIHEESAFIGKATNNTAEYSAIIAAVRKSQEITQGSIVVYSDSELVIRQITGQYRITKPHLAELRTELAELEKQFSSIDFRNVSAAWPFSTAYNHLICPAGFDHTDPCPAPKKSGLFKGLNQKESNPIGFSARINYNLN